MAGAGQKRGRRGIIGGYWGGYSLLSLSPTPRALPGKVENLTPPANGKNGPDGAPPAGTVAAGSGAAGTVDAGPVPAPAARHRNGEQTAAARDMHRDTPGAADRTASADRRPEQQRTTRRRPGLFLLPHLPACRLPGLPDQQPGTRWALPAAAPGKSWKVPGERWTQCMDIAPTTCTGKDQHRQRRTRRPRQQQTTAHDDHAPAPALPRLHSAHSLPALPDLTAAAQPPAPPPRRTSPPAPHTCRRLHRCRLPDDPPRSTPQNGHFAPPPEGSDSPPNGIEL